jgi:hypothetical protein
MELSVKVDVVASFSTVYDRKPLRTTKATLSNRRPPREDGLSYLSLALCQVVSLSSHSFSVLSLNIAMLLRPLLQFLLS